MGLLKKTLIAVGLLVLLKLILVLLDKYSPLTILFHRNFITALQLVIFLWLIISIVIGLFIRKNPRTASRVTWILLILLVAGLELLFVYWFKNPGKAPASLFGSFKEYYIHNYRNIVQVERSCSEFDSTFFYRLKRNNQCTFSNLEFSSIIKTNSLGLRDDEASMTAPDIICIGDSYTMGWGVEQDRAFPAVLERSTGLKVLNAGMSSFGTVRELRQLARLDTSNCKFVVLQYCDNDVQEIKPYVDSNFRLQTSDAASYDTLVKRSEWNHAYYPGKTLFSVGMFKLKSSIKSMMSKGKEEYFIPSGAVKVSVPESAKLFAETLRRSADLFRNRTLVVLYAFEGGRKDTVFTNTLQQLLNTSPYREELNFRIIILNTSNMLDEKDSFIWDDHYNANGHAKIAAAIKNAIGQQQQIPQ